MESIHNAIAKQIRAVEIAQIQLFSLILAACPGPHLPTQHRDFRPPWCKTCGYTATGVRFEPAEDDPRQ